MRPVSPRLGSLLMAHQEAGASLTCALGMALLAHGLEPRGLEDKRLMELYPWLRRQTCSPCPWCGTALRSTGMLAHPFDQHVMTPQCTLDALCEWLARMEANRRRIDRRSPGKMTGIGLLHHKGIMRE